MSKSKVHHFLHGVLTKLSRLSELKGDWHEFESKALRRKKEQRDRDARIKQAQEEQHKRKAAALEGSVDTGPEPKKTKSAVRGDTNGGPPAAAERSPAG